VEEAAGGASREVVARIFVVATPDADRARAVARRAIAAYMNTPGYAAFQRWLGRAELLQPMWDAWAAGDRKGALAAIPDEVTDSLVVHGDPDTCRAHIERYVEAGVDTPVIALLDPEADVPETARALAPR
jgi:alkanesulfonate monooxygenase SsuD/methylene tetrahydromethanopterin reductase-like flavin-dependent oxidoreductase (luciferase family)